MVNVCSKEVADPIVILYEFLSNQYGSIIAKVWKNKGLAGWAGVRIDESRNGGKVFGKIGINVKKGFLELFKKCFIGTISFK